MFSTLCKPTPLDVGRLLFVGTIWGGAFIFIAVALGALVLLVIAQSIGQRFTRVPREWAYIGVVGCLNSTVPFFLISWGQQFISSAETALLTAVGTFFALIVSHFTSQDERINRARASGVTVGFVGVLVLALIMQGIAFTRRGS